jgi:multidrug resistance efflux pump
MPPSGPPDELETTYFQRVVGGDLPARGHALVLAPRQAPLFALVSTPRRPVRPFALVKPWMTLGGDSDDIPLDDPACPPGQIAFRPQGERVLVECSPVTDGILLGRTRVYRAVLQAGDRFCAGRAEVVISQSALPARREPMAMMRLVATRALAHAEPHLAPLGRWLELARTRPRLRRAVRVAAATLLVGAVLPTRVTVDAPCEVVPHARSWVRAPVDGFVKDIRVREGDKVRKGDHLLTMEVLDVDRELARTQHDIDAAKAALGGATRGPRATELMMAQAREQAAHAKAVYLERQRGRIARLAREGVESRQALDDAARDAEVAHAEARLAQVAVLHLEAGAAPEEIESKRAALAKLEAERDFLDRQRGQAEIRSPVDGVVATPKLAELTTKHVTPGTELLLVLEAREVVFEIAVPEKEIEFVKLGEPVRVRLRGDPQHPVDGVIDHVAAHAADSPAGRVVPVRCRADAVPPEALAGLTGNARVWGPRTTWLGLAWKRIHRWVRTDLL